MKINVLKLSAKQMLPGGKKRLPAFKTLLFPKMTQMHLADMDFHLELIDFAWIRSLHLVKASDPIPAWPVLYSYNKLDGDAVGVNM